MSVIVKPSIATYPVYTVQHSAVASSPNGSQSAGWRCGRCLFAPAAGPPPPRDPCCGLDDARREPRAESGSRRRGATGRSPRPLPRRDPRGQARDELEVASFLRARQVHVAAAQVLAVVPPHLSLPGRSHRGAARRGSLFPLSRPVRSRLAGGLHLPSFRAARTSGGAPFAR